VIKEILTDLNILPENIYNINKTGVILSILGSVKVLVSKNNLRDYRGVGVKRTMVTIIKYVSADGWALLLIIVWPVITNRNN
jgi:hypothetical protein